MVRRRPQHRRRARLPRRVRLPARHRVQRQSRARLLLHRQVRRPHRVRRRARLPHRARLPARRQSRAQLPARRQSRVRLLLPVQSFTVPTGNSTIMLSYWWYGLTQHRTSLCVDTLAVTVLDGNGHMIGRLQLACNYNAAARWLHASFNVTSLLSRYGGKTVMLFFAARTSPSLLTTSFFVDDVALTLSTPTPGPGGGPPKLPPVSPGPSLPAERKDG